MNIHLKINILLSLAFLSLQAEDYPHLHTPFERDATIFIDWDTEPIDKFFLATQKPGTSVTSALYPTVAYHLVSALYNPASVIVTSATAWESIAERAAIIENAVNLSKDEFKKYLLDKYGGRQNLLTSMLYNDAQLETLQKFCYAAKQIHQEVNYFIANELTKTNDMQTIASQVSSLFTLQSTRIILKDPTDKALFDAATSQLAMCYYLVEKLKKEQDAWIFRKADECIYVMISKSYLDGIKNKSLAMSSNLNQILTNTIKDNKTGRFLTIDEMILGIKFEGLAPLDLFTVTKPTTCTSSSPAHEQFIKKTGSTFDGTLTRIFITKQDLNTFNEDQFTQHNTISWLPHYYSWNFYGVGHGAPQGTVTMGLKAATFSNFIDFLNTNINTRLLVYVSCYAGGVSLKQYFDQQKNDPKDLNYMVIVGSLQETYSSSLPIGFILPPLYAIDPNAIDIKTKSLVPTNLLKYAQFFNDLHKSTTGSLVTYQDILNNILNPKVYENTPQIKFPGSLWFNVIDLNNNMIRLTQTLVRTKAAEINVAQTPEARQFIIHNKGLLLLDSAGDITKPVYTEIPFPITIEGSMPTIVSMAMGTGLYGFTTINAPSIGFTEFLQKFWGLTEVKFVRTYFIDNLIVKNDLQVPADIGAPSTPILQLKNVTILSNSTDPIYRKQSMRGVIFQSNDSSIYSSLYSVKDPVEVKAAKTDLNQYKLPNLVIIKDPAQIAVLTKLKSYVTKGLINNAPSLEPVVQFVINKAQQIKLVKQYEEIKKVSEQALNKWKTTLTLDELKFITNYEEMQKARP